MFVRIIIFLLLCSATAFAQASNGEQAFKKALDEELAKRENGKSLYERSEIYRKTVLRHIGEGSHLGTQYQESGSQIQSQLGIFSGDVSNDAFGQEETSVAISRTDPNLIVIASNDEAANIRSMPVFRSTDGGMTWNTARMPIPPKPYYAYCDPFLAADQYGGFYYAFLIYNEKLSMSNIMVAHSTDGLTWTYGDPVIFGKQSSPNTEDKESIAVDLSTSSSTTGRVYVSWMHFDSDPGKEGLQLAWSDDLGQSWSAPQKVSNGSGFFSQVKIDKNGIVFYTYSDYRDDGSLADHYLLVSTDHGATFIRHKIADYRNYPYSAKQYYPTLKGSRGIRAFPYIVMACDSRRNILHVVYGSYETWNDSVRTAVLYYTKTSDQGDTWSQPLALGLQGDSSSLQTDRFMPWIGIDEVQGDVHLLYYSSQDDPKNIRTEAYRAVIHPQGSISYMHLSDSLFDPLHVTDFTYTPSVGDYTGCSIDGSTFAYAWTEDRKGSADGEIYAYIKNARSGAAIIRQVSATALNIFSVYPNPVSNGKLTLGFANPQSGKISLSLSSANGAFSKKLFQAELASGTYEKEFDLTGIASGNYSISLDNGNISVQKKIVVVR